MSETLVGYEKKSRSKLPLYAGIALILVVALVAAILALSGGKKDSSETKELAIGVLLEPSNLNVRETAGVALDQVLMDNIYQGLVGLTPGTLEIRPVLANNIEISDDAKTYTFTLREGVKFHSGNELQASDVVSSLAETLDGVIESVTAPEKDTVVLKLEEPNSQLLFTLASSQGIILEETATNDLASSANGTGPYKFVEWKQGDSITLDKNDDYWGEAATLDTVVFRYIPDGKAMVNASLNGDLDVQIALTPTLRSEFDNSDFELVRAESTDVFTLAYNNQRAPLDNPRVREALSQAIDPSAVIAALEGDGRSLGGPITQLEPGYEDLTAVNAYDPDNARKILAEEDINDLDLVVTVANFYETTALEIVATQLAAVGVTLTINQVEFGTWLEDVYFNHDYDLSFVDHAEPFDFGNYANPGYYFGFDNAKVQELYASSLTATNAEDSAAHLRDAARVVADEAVAKWLYNYTPTNAINKKVQNFPNSNTNSRINLEGVTIVQ